MQVDSLLNDVAVRRDLRNAIAQALYRCTDAGENIFYDHTIEFTSSQMPGINIVHFPIENKPDAVEKQVGFLVLASVQAPTGDTMVRDEATGLCVDPLVVAADTLDEQIAERLSGLSIKFGCSATCTRVHVATSALQFSSAGAKRMALIRRLIIADYIEQI